MIEYLVFQQPETESTEQKTIPDSGTHAVSHLNLVNSLQDHLIGFIVGKPVQKFAEDEIFIWGRDGSSGVEQLVETLRWTERIGRLKLLEKYTSSMPKALRTL